MKALQTIDQMNHPMKGCMCYTQKIEIIRHSAKPYISDIPVYDSYLA